MLLLLVGVGRSSGPRVVARRAIGRLALGRRRVVLLLLRWVRAVGGSRSGVDGLLLLLRGRVVRGWRVVVVSVVGVVGVMGGVVLLLLRVVVSGWLLVPGIFLLRLGYVLEAVFYEAVDVSGVVLLVADALAHSLEALHYEVALGGVAVVQHLLDHIVSELVAYDFKEGSLEFAGVGAGGADD